MQSKEEIRRIIDAAIQQQRAVKLNYKTMSGEINERTVEPLEWVEGYKFNAFCHLRNAERHFVISGVLAVQFEDNNGSEGTNTLRESVAYHVARTAREEFNLAQPKISQAIPDPLPAASLPEPAGEPFTVINENSQWSRLMRYFVECLIREYQQQYVIDDSKQPYVFFPLEAPTAREFVSGRTSLTFPLKEEKNPTKLAEFVFSREHKNARLCVGYPVLALGHDTFAPMLFAEITFTKDEDKNAFQLTAQDYEISYAALRKLRLADEEVASVFDECQTLIENSAENALAVVEAHILSVLESLLEQPLPRFQAQRLNPTYSGETFYALYESPCLFWVTGNIITGNLIEELRSLSVKSWTSMPDTITALLNQAPASGYPDVSPFGRDTSVYISSTNDQQRRAVDAARRMMLSVVTGPPGTGKSQLVVNAIADAVQRGERVLFSSRNNNAVNVVIERLRTESDFQGVVRTGNRTMRREAALQIQRSLENIGVQQRSDSNRQLREQYFALKAELLQTLNTLGERQQTTARLDEAERQLEELRRHVEVPIWEAACQYEPRFQQADYKDLGAAIADLQEGVQKLQRNRAELLEIIRVHITDNEPKHQIIEDIRQFELQWGRFGAGLLHQTHFRVAEEIVQYAQSWSAALSAIEKQKQVNDLMLSLLGYATDYERLVDRLPAHYHARIPDLCQNKTSASIQSAITAVHDWCVQAQNAGQAGTKSILRRLMARCNAPNLNEIDAQLAYFEQSTGLSLSEKEQPTRDRLERIKHFEYLLHACDLYIRQAEVRQHIEKARAVAAAECAMLPEEVQSDILNLSIASGEMTALKAQLKALENRAKQLVESRKQLQQRIDAQFNLKADILPMLAHFKEHTKQSFPQLWKLSLAASLNEIAHYIGQWPHILECWFWRALYDRNQKALALLPSAEALQEQRNLHQSALDRTGAGTLATCWLERVSSLETTVLQNARAFAHALQALNQEDYEHDRYQEYKSDQENHLPAAMQVFPVWGTTNLTAKSNFPLDQGIFDLVIIDEASQCDLPSALPLLYRAKRAMIIGDAKQLRHIATLSEKTDSDLCYQYGIDRDMYSCVEYSLFDMALRSTTPNPGYILLEEHYRSHPDIINFSNQAFYDGRLSILTDMRGRDIPPVILEQACGVHWLNVPGAVEHPSSGSAVNRQELATVKRCVPDLLAVLELHKWSASIGIVTPYRAQKKLLSDWIERQYGERIVVGTAHTFQGDERDVLVYSPVLASGISEGSQSWLHRTDNLLNVAVTRARCILIIIGDWEYCHALPSGSRYRQLADYVASLNRGPLQSIEEIPLLKLL